MAEGPRIHDTVVHCPHCGHNIHLDVDFSEEEQDYQDECKACGGDIHIRMHRDVGDGKLHIAIDADDEQIY